ncbi:MAG: hypothetical protein ABRQ38_06780 [Candidatus Eremiobacterota bacterium]
MNKKLVFLILLCSFVLFLSVKVYAQEMYFCIDVDSNWKPVKPGHTFYIGSQGNYIYILVKLPYGVGCDKVKYEIYRNGEYDNTFTITTKSDWRTFKKKITFKKEGEYTISVYDKYGNLLAEDVVKIRYRS